MSDIIQIEDLEKTKFHNTFHVEAVTGKAGGLAGGADIDYTTNAVTGQVQKTLPATINGIDWSYVGKFADGVTFTKKTDFAIDASGTQWIYTGSLPFSATAGTVPSEPTYQAVHVKSASAISNANGGSVQDFIDNLDQVHRRVTTVAAVEAGNYEVGAKLELSDRAGAKFDVKLGTADGYAKIFAGAGVVAEICDKDSYNFVNFGLVGDYNHSALTGTDNTAAFASAISIGAKRIDLGYNNAFKTEQIPELFGIEFTGVGCTLNAACIYPVYSAVRYGKINTMPEFSWFTHDLYYSASGFGSTSLTPEMLKPPVLTRYYVGFSDGLDTNDGLTPATSLKTISAAAAKSDCGEISLAPKRYWRIEMDLNFAMPRSMSVICESGRAELVSAMILTYTQSVTYPKVWQASRTLLQENSCFDAKYKDSNGDYKMLTKVDTVADVAAGINRYHYDGTTLSVRLYDDRQPDSDFLALMGSVPFQTNGNGNTLYVENIDFCVTDLIFRSNPATGDGSKTTIVGKNCTFKYSSATSSISGGSGSFRTEGCDSYLFDCVAARAYKDGFNYHEYGANYPNAFEINCIGRDNGFAGLADDVHNGSTMHQGGSVIRINGRYFKNKGPNLPDVGDGTSSLMIGCSAFDSRKASNSRNFDFYSSSNPAKRMVAYLIGVKSYGSTYDLNIPSAADGSPQALVYLYDSGITRNAGKQNAVVQFNPYIY